MRSRLEADHGDSSRWDPEPGPIGLVCAPRKGRLLSGTWPGRGANSQVPRAAARKTNTQNQAIRNPKPAISQLAHLSRVRSAFWVGFGAQGAKLSGITESTDICMYMCPTRTFKDTMVPYSAVLVTRMDCVFIKMAGIYLGADLISKPNLQYQVRGGCYRRMYCQQPLSQFGRFHCPSLPSRTLPPCSGRKEQGEVGGHDSFPPS